MTSKTLLEKILYAEVETDTPKTKEDVRAKYNNQKYRMQTNYGETKFIKP